MTTAAVVIPKSMAYATVAGLPIQVGLYTAFVPMIIYAVLGTSRPLSRQHDARRSQSSPRRNSARRFRTVIPPRMLGATAMLTAIVGIVLIAASALRLGFVANFISAPVLIGFKAGIAVVIIVDQLPKILGIHFAKGDVPAQRGVDRVRASASVGRDAGGRRRRRSRSLGTIEHFRPHWPAPLIAVAGAIAGAGLFAWQSYGIELVGAIPSGLPSITMPDLDARAAAVARRGRYRVDELHRDHCGGSRVRRRRRAVAAPQYGIVGDRDLRMSAARSSDRCPAAAARRRRRSIG